MFQRLRLDAVIGGHHQDHKVNAGGPGQHVVDEPLVAGNVNKPEHRSIRARQIRKAEIDGNAARLFFPEAIRFYSGERTHQRGLAMIDMARGSDDHGDCSRSGLAARCSASAISPAVRTERAALRNREASSLFPAAARKSQTSAWFGSRWTPAPR